MRKDADPLDEWRRLYDAAVRVKELAPWEYMTESQVFGVQNPESGELGFVSVMGLMGEHFAVSVYLGPKGLYGFLDISCQETPPEIEQIFEIPQLQASFEDRKQLGRDDLQMIKQLGLTFRGRNAWPWFRSFRPGFVPWSLEPNEIPLLACALEQLADVAPRFKKDPSILEPSGMSDFLVRVPARQGKDLGWTDQVTHIPMPEPTEIPVKIDGELIDRVKGLARTQGSIEAAFVTIPAAIGEKGTRPSYPYALLAVDAQTGMVLPGEVMTIETTLEAMWGRIPQSLLSLFANIGSVPGEVRVQSDLLLELLPPLAEELEFSLTHSDRLSNLERAKSEMFRFFEKGF